MTYSRKNTGTCSHSTTVTLDGSGTIEDIRVEGGCDGNLQGLCALLKGQNASNAAALLANITCEGKPNSCPRQISLCLTEALNAGG